ncbi:phosphotransferase [Microlunatus parietis]|uniref:Aminoglycoside phosphotransferase domain-containing protein n=1 Tax=Microlunatus parietis TaxID=682979 RepID=A0A7Y9I8E9_9ACTN|nr:hypothetical protein [Microlunatus parietis]
MGETARPAARCLGVAGGAGFLWLCSRQTRQRHAWEAAYMNRSPLNDLVRRAGEVVGRELKLTGELLGGGHAVAVGARDAEGNEYVVRHFPVGDRAVVEEVRVMERLASLGPLAPRLVGHSVGDAAGSIIATSKLAGGHPVKELSLSGIGTEMARVPARIHAIDGRGLRPVMTGPPSGDGPAAAAARDRESRWTGPEGSWCTTTSVRECPVARELAIRGGRLVGRSLRTSGVDVAWCRQDLVLLGSTEAADHFLRKYEEAAEGGDRERCGVGSRGCWARVGRGGDVGGELCRNRPP